MKKRLLVCGLLTAVFSMPLWAADATPQPSRTSVDQLLALSDAKRLLDVALRQMQAVGAQEIQKSEMSAAQKRVVTKYQTSISSLIRNKFSFEQLHDELAEIYQQTFSQKEVDAMINFYRTPEGQAMLQKMPIISQQSMKVIMLRAQQLQPEINKLAKQMQKELTALEK